jgi:hypothetical protein
MKVRTLEWRSSRLILSLLLLPAACASERDFGPGYTAKDAETTYAMCLMSATTPASTSGDADAVLRQAGETCAEKRSDWPYLERKQAPEGANQRVARSEAQYLSVVRKRLDER